MATQMYELHRKLPENYIKELPELPCTDGSPRVINQLKDIQRMLKTFEKQNKITDYDDVKYYSEEGPYRFSKGEFDWDLEYVEPYIEHPVSKLKNRDSPFAPDGIIGLIKDRRRKEFVKKLFVGCRNIPVYEKTMNQGVTKPLVGAIPQKMEQIAQEGDMVAALINNVDQEKLVWMLAVVMLYNDEMDMYGLSDIDPLSADNTMYMVPYDNVIALAHYRANPEIAAHALHKVGERVMAVCPGTTLFLIGVVKCQPDTSSGDYTIVLYHHSFNKGRTKPLSIPQRFTISMSAPQMRQHDKY